MCPVPPTTTVTSNTSSTNEPNDDEDDVTMSSSETSLNIERSKKQRIYDYDSDAETEVWQLSAIATDWTLMINRLAANCRNISDEVFPGIHVGDRLRLVTCHDQHFIAKFQTYHFAILGNCPVHEF
jgi:hypothetical protein